MKKLYFTSIFLFLSGIILAQDITLEIFKSGFSRPLSLQHANDDRLFVVEQGGKIKIIQPDGTVNSTPFLNISGQVSNGSEQGLLGLAFHPDYASNGYFYVNYTNTNGNTQVSRFSVDASNDDIADSNSELPILDFNQPYSNHNGGTLLFGPDGYLYISSGDGGSSGDPNDEAQNLTSYLGKILRIDVDTEDQPYLIPADNPLLHAEEEARNEIYAYGLRNPWKFSFDEGRNLLVAADVGQGEIEEIDLIVSGGNYGWNRFEGTRPYKDG